MQISDSIVDSLASSGNYSLLFDRYRINRCNISLYKYGSAKKNFPNNVNALETAQLCIKKYLDTKNKEYLCDAANYLMFEFMYPLEQGTYFKSTDSNDSAGIVGMSVKEMEEFKNADSTYIPY